MEKSTPAPVCDSPLLRASKTLPHNFLQSSDPLWSWSCSSSWQILTALVNCSPKLFHPLFSSSQPTLAVCRVVRSISVSERLVLSARSIETTYSPMPTLYCDVCSHASAARHASPTTAASEPLSVSCFLFLGLKSRPAATSGIQTQSVKTTRT